MTQATTKREVLSYADRITIASVLTWDACGNYTYSPDEILAIRIDKDVVWVKLTSDRSRPVCRFVFRSIVEKLKASAQKQIDAIIEAEQEELAEAEREMSEIIHSTAQQEFESLVFPLSPDYDWLTEPVGLTAEILFPQAGV